MTTFALIVMAGVMLTASPAGASTRTYKNSSGAQNTWYSYAYPTTIKGGYAETLSLDYAYVDIQTFYCSGQCSPSVLYSAEAYGGLVTMSHAAASYSRSRCSWHLFGDTSTNGSASMACKYTY